VGANQRSSEVDGREGTGNVTAGERERADPDRDVADHGLVMGGQGNLSCLAQLGLRDIPFAA